MNNMLMIYPAFLDFQEIVIILVVAVVIFGPDKIPEIARGLGQGVRKMKEATEDIKQEILNPTEGLDPTKEIRETIADLDPTKEIKESLANLDPTKDIKNAFSDTDNQNITQAFEDPINELEKVIMDESPEITKVDEISKVVETVEISKTEIEVVTEQKLGSGGSVSR